MQQSHMNVKLLLGPEGGEENKKIYTHPNSGIKLIRKRKRKSGIISVLTPGQKVKISTSGLNIVTSLVVPMILVPYYIATFSRLPHTSGLG